VERRLPRAVAEEYILPRIIGRPQRGGLTSILRRMWPVMVGVVGIGVSYGIADEVLSRPPRYLGLLLVFVFLSRWVAGEHTSLRKVGLLWKGLYVISWVVLYVLSTIGVDILAGTSVGAYFVHRLPVLEPLIKHEYSTWLIGSLTGIWTVVQVAEVAKDSGDA
jgi:hypothetical protein